MKNGIIYYEIFIEKPIFEKLIYTIDHISLNFSKVLRVLNLLISENFCSKMNIYLSISLILHLIKICYCIDNFSEKVINYFIQDTKNNTGSQRITLIADSSSTVLSTSEFFMQGIVKTFPSLVVNITEFLNKSR